MIQMLVKNVSINQLKNNDNNFFDSIITLRSCGTKVAKEKFMMQKINKCLGC